MNLIGKIFVILILIMSLVFMGFAVTIYATHTNWKERAAKLDSDLKEAQKKVQQITQEKDERLKELNEEISRRVAELGKLQSKVDGLTNENKRFQDELTELNANKEQAISAVKLSHESQANLRAEVDGLRKVLRKSQEDWAELYSTYVAKTDEAHDLALKLATYRSVGERLSKDYRDALDVLKKHNLKPVPEMYSGIPPKGVNGLVTEVRPNGWIEISLGEDSGIMKGHRLDIVRNRDGRSSYIGKIEVVRTAPDRAAALILPEFRRGTVQRDDRVEYIDINEFSAN
jgi:peptidoglycan hydrolase CwlO-like protein